MAKIALITEQITPSVLQWAEGLLQQHHQARIITSKTARWNERSEIPIQQYFKNWSLIEALQLLPSLTQDMPDLFHFIFQTEKESASGAHWSLFSFAQSLRRPVVSSLLARPGKQWRWNPFLRWSDGVSFETKDSLMRAKRTGLLDRHQKTEILLPIVPPGETLAHLQIDQLLASLGKYLFVAGPPDREMMDTLYEALGSSATYPVFWGPRRAHLRHRLQYTALSDGGPQLMEMLTAHSEGLLLCFHDFSPAELMRWKALSLRHSVPIWIRPDQLESVPGLCRHGKTGFVLNPDAADIHKLLQLDRTAFDLGNTAQSTYAVELSDQTLNLLNRFYSHFLNT